MIKRSKNFKIADVISKSTGKSWAYSEIVKEHFFHPRNLLLKDPKPDEFNAEGQIGSPACGDVMRMWAKIDSKTERIKKLKWRTFGCGSAIATTSIFSVMVTEKEGMKIDEALKIKPQDIMKKLGGLPARKVHCSVLADKAFQATINSYFRKTGQHHRIIIEGQKVLDPKINLTDKDIEEAVLEGARTIEDLQKRLKVGIGNPEIIPEIEQLLRFYQEKYYG
ncbi:MAG TPA: iron-sulfur cluster assembly scaffold protein [Candidatus Nealsonbacteria bacterium]|uniref:NIF system FeS cluster assembly NifU N-terminal domain-containing protein n=1 Tax=marine sediment metagenome TaxID=412755 RepID=A0A0F9SJZ1_9ZZZZ|nr:iron-sulfur cluster assembly scaffold protein [Candidatus Nealsonbacteria bacterium]HEB46202.1 iron-sulfur cluster assembly scaffold protein [Candidatus Nealsonbacteria bacterium]